MKSRRRTAVRDTAVSFLILLAAAAGLAVLLRFMAPEGSELGIRNSSELYRATVPDGEIRVHVIDVDQADSVLVRSSDGNILIDTGMNVTGSSLKAHLYSCGIRSIDFLILTHPHSDHIGNADAVINEFDVKKVLMTDTESTEPCFEDLLDAIEKNGTDTEIPNLGDTYRLGDITFTFLAPVVPTDDINNMSLALKLEFGETSFLFTGDAEEVSELAMLEHFGEDMLDCDFYKVGHHGSDTSSCKPFLEAVTPDIAVVSCGRGNSYGHPRSEVLERLSEVGCETVLRTDEMGTVAVRSDGKTLTVISARQ